MYLFACRIKIKMRLSFSTSNCKILYFAILEVCRNNFSQSNYTDCNITKIKGKKNLFGGVPRLLSMF
jgi:hypothetical protein